MADVIPADILLYSMSIISLILGVFIGKFMDPYFRASLFRKITKKEWGVLNITSSDTKTIRSIVVNFSGDVINVKGRIWIIQDKRIYRQDKVERGFSLAREDLKLSWTEGIPSVYVNELSVLPISLDTPPSAVNPSEVTTVFMAWVNNQLLKGFAAIKNQQMFITITMVVVLLLGVADYLLYQSLSDTHNMVVAIDAKVNSLRSTGTSSASPLTPATLPAGVGGAQGATGGK